ncbi:MAG: hypothetical protein AAF202_06865, partial [Pseudomonadota bacterium]
MASPKTKGRQKVSQSQAYLFSVEGMSCSHCLNKVRELGLFEFHASDIAINLDRGTVRLDVEGNFDSDKFIGRLQRLGFAAHAQKS